MERLPQPETVQENPNANFVCKHYNNYFNAVDLGNRSIYRLYPGGTAHNTAHRALDAYLSAVLNNLFCWFNELCTARWGPQKNFHMKPFCYKITTVVMDKLKSKKS